MKQLFFILTLFLLSEISEAQADLKVTCFDSTKSQVEESISFYLNRLALDSTDQLAYYKIGMAYYKLRNYEKAIENFDKLIVLNPDYPAALSNRGLCKLFSNDKTGACNDFIYSVKLGQDPPLIDGLKLSEWLDTECR